MQRPKGERTKLVRTLQVAEEMMEHGGEQESNS